VAGASVTAYGLWLLKPVSAVSQPREFTVPEGWGGGRIAAELNREGFIRSAFAMVVVANVMHTGDSLKAGRYLLSADMSTPEIVRAIADGHALSDDHLVTVPEGMNVWETDRILSDAGIIKHGELRTAYAHKEGHLFPETYRFAKDATVDDVARKMEATYFERGGTRGDIELIVASMLEKEAKTPDDMALVAGIIFKRLDIGMVLQIDATVAYGWCLRTAGVARDCDVTQAPIATELKVDGPYNTYARGGLPQGAISNPGINALQAAANPQESDYLFYLSTRDGSDIIYSKTLEEHLRNRAKYLGL
jgi:UPF0755 protein